MKHKWISRAAEDEHKTRSLRVGRNAVCSAHPPRARLHRTEGRPSYRHLRALRLDQHVAKRAPQPVAHHQSGLGCREALPSDNTDSKSRFPATAVATNLSTKILNSKMIAAFIANSRNSAGSNKWIDRKSRVYRAAASINCNTRGKKFCSKCRRGNLPS